MGKNRRDAKRITNLTSTSAIIYQLKKKRCDSDVYINQKIDMTNTIKYVNALKEKGHKITYFHIFCAALAKTIYNRPAINRFIMKGKFYEHNDVSLGFVAKVKFEDFSEEYLSVEHFAKDDNIFNCIEKLNNTVKKVRSDNKNTTDKTADLLAKLPIWLTGIVMGFIKFLDNRDLLPKSITANSIYHSSAIVSNLGSINCGSIYHNLTDFGTASSLITMGKIHKEPVINENGEIVVKDICDFGMNIDERIGDGFYFIKTIELFEYILNNPEVLEEPLGKKIDIWL